jgi:hypothetical protein
MTIKEITLLSKNEFEQYKDIIPVVHHRWWLCTPGGFWKHAFCVGNDGNINDKYGIGINCFYIGVRPFCVFEASTSDTAFWLKPGSEFSFGEYHWTILDIKDDNVYALCNKIIGKNCFDKQSNDWETSQLKRWLETEGLKLVTA